MRFQSILASILFFVSTVAWATSSCEPFFGEENLKTITKEQRAHLEKTGFLGDRHILSIQRERWVYEVRDLDTYYDAFFARASVAWDKSLRIALKTRQVDHHGNFIHSKWLSGEDQYAKILKHYEGQFRNILGLWGGKSDNLDQFNAYLKPFVKRKLSRKEKTELMKQAAKSTWSGRQAVKHGYTRVKIYKSTLVGDFGSYVKVNVSFHKPKK